MFTVLEAYQTGVTATAETVSCSTAKGTGTPKRSPRGRGQRAAGWGGVFCQSVEGQYKVWVDNCQVGEGMSTNQLYFQWAGIRGPSHLSRHCLSCWKMLCKFYCILL